jgi:hypothetical protein
MPLRTTSAKAGAPAMSTSRVAPNAASASGATRKKFVMIRFFVITSTVAITSSNARAPNRTT